MRGAPAATATASSTPTSGRRCRSASARCCACSRGWAGPTCPRAACSRWAAAPAATCSSCCAWASRRATWRASSCCPSASRSDAALPSGVALMQGDASLVKLPDESEDIVLQSDRVLVAARRAVPVAAGADHVALGAARRRRAVVRLHRRQPAQPRRARRAAGAHPRAVPARARCSYRRVTLAPPLARAVCRVHPALYPVFNALPLLRTHVLAWIEKPDA